MTTAESAVGVVTVIEPGKLVRVDPPALNVDDVIEFAEALIEEEGHVKGEGGEGKRGWSIHGAIGEAAKRATGEGGKDGTRSRELRNQATAKLTEAFPQQNEYELNDTAADGSEAIERLQQARGVVTAGGEATV